MNPKSEQHSEPEPEPDNEFKENWVCVEEFYDYIFTLSLFKVKTLLKLGMIRINSYENFNGNNLLFLSVLKKRPDLFALFLESSLIDLNKRNFFGENIFHYICRYGTTDYLLALSNQNSEKFSSLTKTIKRMGGKTGLTMAYLENNKEVCHWLAANGFGNDIQFDIIERQRETSLSFDETHQAFLAGLEIYRIELRREIGKILFEHLKIHDVVNEIFRYISL